VRFSPTHSALEGFRLVRRRPASFVVWALVTGVMAGAFLAVFVWLWRDAASLDTARPPPTEQIFAFIGRFGLTWLGALIGMLIFTSVLIAAVYRAVLRPDRPGFAYLRLGGAELRLAALQIILFAVLMLCELVIFGVAAGVAVSGLELWAKVLIGACAVVGVIVFMVFLLVRLSLAGPLVVAEGRLSFGAAWRVSRGKFWPLLGMALLAALLAMAVSMFAQGLMQPVMMMAMGGDRLASFGPAAGKAQWPSFDLGAWILANPGLFAVVAVLSVLGLALQIVIQAAPWAEAYRVLREER
jgi:hypothetical protein